ncbi:MAG: GNAT family N-acetyltransferase [Bacteroidota bacterium]
MGNELLIRAAKLEDIPQVFGLIVELAVFEKAPDEVDLTAAQLEFDAFGEKPIIEIIVAEEDGVVLGAALFYEKYSTWKGRGVHLEDFVVKASERRRGIGSKLFEEVMRIAKERNYARMDWQVLDWNESAIAFYKKYEAEISEEWLNGRFTKEQLQRS